LFWGVKYIPPAGYKGTISKGKGREGKGRRERYKGRRGDGKEWQG